METMIDEYKICFIIYVNNDLFFEECARYIRWLAVPEKMEVELLEIRGANSMASGYNEGMCNSNAKYKVYMHQDVFLINKYFIYDLISLFHKSEKIGMIGLVGSPKMPENGVMWSEGRVGGGNMASTPWGEYRYDIEKDGWWEVEGIDGLLMATQCDVPWREDLFDGWDFYDASYCFEMRKKGMHIIVPVQRYTWFIHDDKDALALWNYNKYRNIFINEYMKKSE